MTVEVQTLEQFLEYFLSRPIGFVTMAQFSGEVRVHEKVTTYTLFRFPPFQVELVLLNPETEWPGEHRHPNVDTVEVDLNNAVVFTKNGEVRSNPDFTVPVEISPGLVVSCNCVRLLPTDLHGISKVSEKGAAILSVQKWLNDLHPTSIGLDWSGKPTCEGHAKQIAAEVGSV